jgi:hypothetical protein
MFFSLIFSYKRFCPIPEGRFKHKMFVREFTGWATGSQRGKSSQEPLNSVFMGWKGIAISATGFFSFNNHGVGIFPVPVFC